MAEDLNAYPPEIREMILLQDIGALNRYCQTHRGSRRDCPKLYAKLLWNKFRIKTDLDASLSANIQIARLRSTYDAEEARLIALDSAIAKLSPTNLDPKPALRLMQFTDPKRKPLNINYRYREEDEEDDEQLPDTLLDRLMYQYTERMEDDYSDELLVTLLDTVNYFVGTLGAEPSPSLGVCRWRGSCRTIDLLVLALSRKKTEFDSLLLNAVEKLFDLLLMAGGGPIAQGNLPTAIENGMQQSMFKLLLQKIDSKTQAAFVYQVFTTKPFSGELTVFPWRLFDRDMIFKVFDEAVSSRRKVNQFVSIRGWHEVDPHEDLIVEYLKWKARHTLQRKTPADILREWVSSPYRWWFKDRTWESSPLYNVYPETWLTNVTRDAAYRGLISQQDLADLLRLDRENWETRDSYPKGVKMPRVGVLRGSTWIDTVYDWDL